MTTWLIAGASIAAFIGFVTLLHFLRNETLKRGKDEVRLEDAEETKSALEVVVAVDSRVDSMPDTDELCDALNRRK